MSPRTTKLVKPEDKNNKGSKRVSICTKTKVGGRLLDMSPQTIKLVKPENKNNKASKRVKFDLSKITFYAF